MIMVMGVFAMDHGLFSLFIDYLLCLLDFFRLFTVPIKHNDFA